MSSSKTPTMKDVARKAAVSLGTVSKVINGVPVSETNRIKVEKAIQDLDYKVNTYARGLKLQKSNLVALIIPNTANPFFANFTNQIEAALYEKNLKLLLCCSDGIPQKEIEYLNMATNNKVEGVIALTYSDIGNYIPEKMPIVVFDRYFENLMIPRVASDNFAGACLAIEKLLDLGCHHPVYIRFHSVYPGESDKRKEGYLHACKKHNLVPDYIDMIDCDNKLDIMKEFLDKHKNPDGTLSFDGVFAHTDYHGYIFMKLLKKEGYKIPEDVQIIGFDGIHKFGNEEDDLFVSSICQPVKQLAEKCVEIIIMQEKNQGKVPAPTLTLLPVEYHYGGTTKE